MAKRGTADSLVTEVHERIRADILNGHWEPGEQLRVSALAKHYETSTTVVREALTRLAGQRFVHLRPNHGFSVPRLSLADLQDITLVRCHTETLALRLAIERGDLAWESEVVAAHHRLANTPRRREDDPERVTEEWSAAHRSLHRTLIEACGVPTLLDMCDTLFDITELRRRWSAPTLAASVRDVAAEHADLVAAALARDTERATEQLREHYERTSRILLESGLVEGVERMDDTAR
ncbi:GntR family transcriptional regulator [Streptomyces sp. NPDC052052]|uniref:GntR family transcriptional regulator n=1 Tax=Streptomyces sp. NPDC052052 TaxID=3154756 RepID=UPI00342A7EF1